MKTGRWIAAAAAVMVSLAAALAVTLPASAADAQWKVVYWNNTTLKGSPVSSGTEKRLAHDWRNASPVPGTVNRDKFSARWTRTVNLAAGVYIFRTQSDDGIRVWMDNKQVINQWDNHPYQTAVVPVNVKAGDHTFRVEYYDFTGAALANFSYAPLKANPWDVQYFKGSSLSGKVIVDQEENDIRNYWGRENPVPGVGANNFSVRYTRKVNFPGGPMKIKVTVDGGYRLYVGGKLIVDRWFDHELKTETFVRTIAAGQRSVRLEYFNRNYPAVLRFKMKPRK